MQNQFDPAVLNELQAQIGGEAVGRIVALFKADVTRRLGLLSGLMGVELSRAAHALKGSALEVGATALATAAQELEKSAATLAPDAIPGRIAALDGLVAQTFVILDQIATQDP
jgi:HPt (histidine-containing phosphotransfer) domain-containing protein